MSEHRSRRRRLPAVPWSWVVLFVVGLLLTLAIVAALPWIA